MAHAEPAVVVERDQDDVEPAAHVAEALPLEVLLGEPDDPPPLPPLDGRARAVVPAGPARLHLDEDPDITVAADEVELALAEAHVALDDDEAGALEVARGGLLGLLAAEVARVGHAFIVRRACRPGNVQSPRQMVPSSVRTSALPSLSPSLGLAKEQGDAAGR